MILLFYDFIIPIFIGIDQTAELIVMYYNYLY